MDSEHSVKWTEAAKVKYDSLLEMQMWDNRKQMGIPC